jgi:hypothetical protein
LPLNLGPGRAPLQQQDLSLASRRSHQRIRNIPAKAHINPARGYLDAVQPRLIIATSRDFPEYERINDQWAEDVRARGIKLFHRDESGAVTLRFDDNGWEA